jgi:hypothetical protein
MKMSPVCQLEMTLPGGFSGVTVRLMSDGELSRLNSPQRQAKIEHALDHAAAGTRTRKRSGRAAWPRLWATAAAI